MIYFKQLELGPMLNFVYLIGDPKTREAAVVDPGWDVPRILSLLDEDGYKLSQVWITHAHPDHTLGLNEVLTHKDVPVFAHAYEAEFLPIESNAVRSVSGAERLALGEIKAECVHTPGHTVGSLCYLVEGHLITGDTLFIKGCGRTDLPGGDTEALYHSLERLRRMDDTFVIYPGHNYAQECSMTLGEEKRSSPFLQQPSAEAFLKLLGR